MKKLIAIAVVSLLAVFASQAGNYISLINGLAYTNATIVLQTATNAWTTNQVGVVLGSTNNYYNLAAGLGIQTNPTNQPSCGFSPQGNYPGTLYGPFKNATFVKSAALTATNSSSTTLTFVYAGSIDASMWASNYYTETYIIPVNKKTIYAVATTNDFGAMPIVALQEIDNSGVADVTNIVLEVNGKPGL